MTTHSAIGSAKKTIAGPMTARTAVKSSKKTKSDRGPLAAWTLTLILVGVAVWIILKFFWGPAIYQVSGTILRNGQPISLEKCRITFLNEKGLFAPATFDATGKFRVCNYKECGLPPGKYQVVISFPTGYLPPTMPGNVAYPPRELEQLIGRFIPRKYRDPATSGLTLELIDHDVEFNVNMTD